MYDNPYNSPEKFGLEILNTWDANLVHQFDTVVVWKSFETNRLYWAHDAGCSCPMPFEDYDLSNLPVLNHLTYDQFEREARELGATPTQLQGIRRRIKE